MKAGSILRAVAAVAPVPFERIRPLLTADGVRMLLDIERRAAALTVGVDQAKSLAWMHGGYWYQGEYVFAPHPDGTEVTYRIRNISGRPDVLIRLWQWRMLKNQQRHLEAYVAALPGRLG